MRTPTSLHLVKIEKARATSKNSNVSPSPSRRAQRRHLPPFLQRGEKIGGKRIKNKSPPPPPLATKFSHLPVSAIMSRTNDVSTSPCHYWQTTMTRPSALLIKTLAIIVVLIYTCNYANSTKLSKHTDDAFKNRDYNPTTKTVSSAGHHQGRDNEPVIEEVNAKQLERILNDKDFVAVYWCKLIFFQNFNFKFEKKKTIPATFINQM